MAALKSSQITKMDASPRKPLKTNELHGRVRIAYFDFTVPAGNAAVDDTISLVRLPLGARILGGHLAHGAMSTGAGAASVQIGTAADPDRYLGTTSVDAAGSAAFANTLALNYGEELGEETDVIATVKTEALAAAGVLQGHILYALD